VGVVWRRSGREGEGEKGSLRAEVEGGGVEGGGVGATRMAWLTGGPGRDGGPGHQRLGAA
jgi:hypothetical protein